PRSSILRTIPVAFIYIPPAIVSFAVKVVFAGKIEIYATDCHGTNWQKRTTSKHKFHKDL
ncbi:MAG: hypothetical protein IKK54_02380, partial [Anaerotignum sp.]|nr:hypothetical protein [Anaerotignum sp.]